MQPPQALHQIPPVLHADQPLTHFLLHALIQIQKPLHELPIHKPPRLLSLPLRIPETAVRCPRDISGRLGELGKARLEADEQVLRRRGDGAEEVQGAFSLCGKSVRILQGSAEGQLGENGK